MMIEERKPDPGRVKEVKVKIPLSYHIKLHSMKVLTGKQISDTITDALHEYFAAYHARTADTVGVGEMPGHSPPSFH
ncbi:MAG: hypothetical protein ACT4PT_13525 [Methanobacteriota archaeon]